VPESFDRDLTVSGGSGTINIDGEDDWQLGDLDVKLGSGKLNVQNIHALDVLIKASSGFVNVDGVTAEESEFRISSGKANINNVQAEYVSLVATSGNIDADSITAKETDTNLSSGNFSLNNITGGLTGQLSSGRLAVHFKEVTDAIDLNASSGRIQLDLPNDGDYSLNGVYNSGHISANLPLENKTETKNSITGKSGTGEHEINISVTSGSAEIN
jgi:lia operon protein LiaG